MSNDNSNNDGRNASDGRVYISGGGTGSIWDVAASLGINPNDPNGTSGVSGGLHSSGQGNHERNHEQVRSPSGPVDLGGGIQAVRDGFRVTGGQLQPGDILKMPDGMEVSYDDAVAFGLIKGNANSGVRPASQSEMDANDPEQQADQPKSTRESDGLGVEAFDVVTTALSKDEGAFVNASTDVIQSEDGILSEASTVELARRLGVSPQEAQRQTGVVVQGYCRDASRALQASTGFSGDLIAEALNDALVSRPGETREAMQRHVNEGDPSVYSEFVTRYVAGLGDTAPHRLIGQDLGGIRPYAGPNGEAMVKVGGMELRWADYILGGYHKRGR